MAAALQVLQIRPTTDNTISAYTQKYNHTLKIGITKFLNKFVNLKYGQLFPWCFPFSASSGHTYAIVSSLQIWPKKCTLYVQCTHSAIAAAK